MSEHEFHAHVHMHNSHPSQMLATDPIFRNTHYTGMSLPDVRDLVHRQVATFARHPTYRFMDCLEKPLRYIACQEVSDGDAGCTIKWGC